MDSREAEVITKHFVDLFSRYEWRWFGSLEVSDRSRESAIRMFEEWVTRIAKEEGSSHFRWVRVVRPIGREHFHFHVLVGGFRDRMTHWSHQWRRLGGKARIQKYDHNLACFLQMLKPAKSKAGLDIDFKLKPRAD
jgi:hypothetical protein